MQSKGTAAWRFWSKVEFTDTCWLWTAAQNGKGYGRFWDGSRLVVAHRWAYLFCVGPIPDGLTLDHSCRVRNCVRPEHLEPVTMRENTMRGVGLAALNARKTRCSNGHEFTEANTRIELSAKGRAWRKCRQCKRANDKARRLTKRAR